MQLLVFYYIFPYTSMLNIVIPFLRYIGFYTNIHKIISKKSCFSKKKCKIKTSLTYMLKHKCQS